jgi:hypothetical protein
MKKCFNALIFSSPVKEKDFFMILEMSGHPNFGLPNSLNLSHFESGPINNPQLTPNGQGENAKNLPTDIQCRS